MSTAMASAIRSTRPEQEYDEQDEIAPLRVVRSSRKKSKNRQASWQQFESVVVLFTIGVFVIAGLMLFCYVGAFARVAVQQREITLINQQLTTATAQHDALVKAVASLTSVDRISHAIGSLQMAQGSGSVQFVDISHDQASDRREIASAL